MRSLFVLTTCATLAIAAPTATALAAPAVPAIGRPADSAACIAAFTEYLAHFNPDTDAVEHGVGTFQRVYATSAPGTIADFNVSINKLHGSLDSCLATEPQTH